MYDNVDMDMAFMYYGIIYPDEAEKEEDKGYMTVCLWQPKMKNGIIEFVRPSEIASEHKRHIKKMEMQITKSVNGESGKESKASDTMGTKHRVDFGVYVIHGSINVQLAEKTGFTEEDAEKIHEALETLFENDCSSARPEGSMEVRRVYWYKHDSKTPKNSSAKVHRLLKVTLKEGIDRPRCFEDYDITLDTIDGLTPEISEG